jgi:hypothetical protein
MEDVQFFGSYLEGDGGLSLSYVPRYFVLHAASCGKSHGEASVFHAGPVHHCGRAATLLQTFHADSSYEEPAYKREVAKWRIWQRACLTTMWAQACPEFTFKACPIAGTIPFTRNAPYLVLSPLMAGHAGEL